MQQESILYEKDKEKQICRITLNRPEKLNAFDLAMMEQLTDRVIEAEADEDTKVIILKGAGRAFSTGYDVTDLGGRLGWTKPTDRPTVRQRLKADKLGYGHRATHQTILNCLKATIAQVQGYCYGGGLEFALVCDIVIASEDALFTHPGFSYIGPAACPDTTLFIHTMGVKKVKEMMLTGRPLDAQEALSCGLINKVVPADKLEEEVSIMAEAIAAQPFDAIVTGKALLGAHLSLMGVGAGYALGSIGHTLATFAHYEPDEYNLFKSMRDKGVKGAMEERESHQAFRLARE